jgi:hypothetical protein
MKKFFYLVAMLLTASVNLCAQDEEYNEESMQSVSQEIWAPKQNKSKGNVFNQNNTVNAKTPPPSIPNIVNTPIDGGVIALLCVGVLYGRRKVLRYKMANH